MQHSLLLLTIKAKDDLASHRKLETDTANLGIAPPTKFHSHIAEFVI
jgi:hypothetical protein